MKVATLCWQQEEQDYGLDPIKGGIREYVSMYKTFSENFTTMLTLVMTEDMNQDVMNQTEEMIDTLKEQILLWVSTSTNPMLYLT